MRKTEKREGTLDHLRKVRERYIARPRTMAIFRREFRGNELQPPQNDSIKKLHMLV